MSEELTVGTALRIIGRMAAFILHAWLIDSWNKRPNGDRRIYGHGQNLNQREHAKLTGPWWKHSRFWLHIGRACLSVEWVLRLRQHPSLEVSHLGDEHDFGGHVTFPGLALYAHATGVLPRGLTRRCWGGRGLTRRCWGGHRTGVSYHDGLLFLRFLHPENGTWSRSETWWQRGEIGVNVHDALRGRAEVERSLLETGKCLVPMPEGVYDASYTIEEMVWRYPRWFTRRRVDVRVQVDAGIPYPGKGENSYDCGMDGTVSVGGSTVHEAVGNFVASVMQRRQRRGGKGWTPKRHEHSARPHVGKS